MKRLIYFLATQLEIDNITYQVVGGSGPEQARLRKALSICGKVPPTPAPANNKQNQQAEPPVSLLAEPVTPRLSSPSLLVKEGTLPGQHQPSLWKMLLWQKQAQDTGVLTSEKSGVS